MKIQTAEHLQYVYGYLLYTYNMYIDVYYNLISTEKVLDKCRCHISYNCNINEETYVKFIIQGTK